MSTQLEQDRAELLDLQTQLREGSDRWNSAQKTAARERVAVLTAQIEQERAANPLAAVPTGYPVGYPAGYPAGYPTTPQLDTDKTELADLRRRQAAVSSQMTPEHKRTIQTRIDALVAHIAEVEASAQPYPNVPVDRRGVGVASSTFPNTSPNFPNNPEPFPDAYLHAISGTFPNASLTGADVVAANGTQAQKASDVAELAALKVKLSATPDAMSAAERAVAQDRVSFLTAQIAKE